MDEATWRAGSQRAKVGAIELAYRIDGDDGSPVLLVMGLAMPGRAWQFQIEDLARSHRVMTFDNRGVGDSERAPGPYSIAMMAQDALGLLDAAGWGDAHVVGVSMGGMIAQEIALRGRNRVRSLTLIATHAGGLRAVVPHRHGLIQFVRAQVGDREQRGQALARLLFPPGFLDSCDRAWLHRTLTADLGNPPPLTTRRAQVGAVLNHRTADRLDRLAGLPTLLVRPDLDTLVRPTQTDRLHRLMPHARVLRIPDAGHGLIRQVPKLLNAELLGHFAAADGARAA